MAPPHGKRSRVEKSQASRKKHRTNNAPAKPRKALTAGQFVPPDKLQWKEVELPDQLEDAEGFFGLEEIDDVEVVRNEKDVTVQYRVVSSRGVPDFHDDELGNTQLEELQDDSDAPEWVGFFDESDGAQVDAPTNDRARENRKEQKKKNKKQETLKKPSRVGHSTTSAGFELLQDLEGDGIDLSAWAALQLSPSLLSSLARLKFPRPTPIQAAAIPEIRDGHDVVGKAVTGSGKTLAYGIPIIEHFLETHAEQASKDATRSSDRTNPPLAMILSPTRELAHQLSKHLNDLCAELDAGRPRIATLTGGLSLLKQKRLLDSADIIIGTPGRLWDVISSTPGLLRWLKMIKFLVLDEADRLLSEGYFKEIEEILSSMDKEEVGNDGAVRDETQSSLARSSRQTLVFSATFEKDLQRKLAGKGRLSESKVTNGQGSLGYLFNKLKFREERPKFIDVNPAAQMASSLREGLVECAALEKDLYLYAVLLHHPNGRILIFTNSISSTRRLVPFLQNLNIQAHALHSQMEQKARLHCIERFACSSSSSVLVATDVAARGLDIPSVQLILHYHIPRTADAYVHRSGRTARAEQSGTSILICAPDEVVPVRRLVAKVHAQDRDSSEKKSKFFIRTLDLDRRVVTRLKPRVSLAKRISDANLAKEKERHEGNWLKTAAEELGVDYDSEEFAAGEGSAMGRGGGKRKRMRAAAETSKSEIAALRTELKGLLNQRVNVGVSEKYLTAGNVDIDELLEGREGEFLGQVQGLDFD